MFRILARLRSDRLGTSVIEFALLAPIFIMMLIGTIEAGRMMWTRQTLEEVAQATARCMAVEDGCTGATAQTFAKDRANGYGIDTTLAEVTVNTGVTCKTYPGSTSVNITEQFDSAIGDLLPAASKRISVSACFPVLAAY